jgi:hypothetical protein
LESERDISRDGLTGPAAAADPFSVESAEDIDEFIKALRRSKQELDIAREQFDTVTDPLLVDHVVFRLGAAEKHLNYLFQVARRFGITTDGMRWDWYEED